MFMHCLGDLFQVTFDITEYIPRGSEATCKAAFTLKSPFMMGIISVIALLFYCNLLNSC